jgi:serine/threonine protein kinase
VSSVPEQIEQLFALMERGAITREEFEEQKQSLLERSRSGSFPPAESEAIAARQGGDVAIKVMHAQFARNETYRARFEQEAALGLKLAHPGIVGVHDLVVDGGHLALVMELVEGRELDGAVGEVAGPLAFERAWAIFEPLLAAVGHAHALGVVHRDLKPENVLLTDDGQPHVIDFGIAKDPEGSGTRTGTGMGTVEYMAPEQYTSAADVDARADIYSLGMILYEMLAGRLPWEASTSQFQIMAAKAERQLVSPTLYAPDIPREIVAVLSPALAPDPAERYPSTAAFGQALREASERAAQRLSADLDAVERATEPDPPEVATPPPSPTPPTSPTPPPASPAPAPVTPAAVPVAPRKTVAEVEPDGTPERPGRSPLVVIAGVLGALGLLGAAAALGVVVVMVGGKGYTLTSDPEGATVSLAASGEILGTTPLTWNDRQELPAGRIQVRMDGRWPVFLDGQELRDQGKRRRRVELAEPPVVDVITSPPGAEVTVAYDLTPDDAEPGTGELSAGTAPLQWTLAEELAAGDAPTVTFRGTLADHMPASVEVPLADLLAGTPVELELRAGATLEIGGQPSGAAVTVTGADGFQHEGALPLVVGGLPAGNYRIKASKSHYETARSTVTLAEGESQVVDLRLQAKLMSAQMSGGDLTVQGAVDRDGVERTVRSDLSQLKYCYARRLDDDPTLAGSVTIEWGIAADGSVSTARAARSTLGDRSVESCLCDRITRMRFPAPAGGTASAGYTFSFKAI